MELSIRSLVYHFLLRDFYVRFTWFECIVFFPLFIPRRYMFPKWKKEEKERIKKWSFSLDSVTIDRYVACKSFRISSFKKKNKKRIEIKNKIEKEKAFQSRTELFLWYWKGLSRCEFLVRLDLSSFSFFFFLRDFDRSYEIGTNRNELECVWEKYCVLCYRRERGL